MPATGSQNLDFSRFEAATKYVYGNAIEDMVPESDKVAKECPFESAEQIGRKFLQPVCLTREMGHTFNSDGSLFTLNAPRARNDLTAEVLGQEHVARTAMSYATMQRALKGDMSTREGKKAFVQATKDSMEALTKGASYVRELMLLYGPGPNANANLGAVSTITSAVTTTLVITLSAADWATAIWAGSEGGCFDIYSTGGTKRNSAGSGITTAFLLSAVNESTRTLTFTSDSTNVAAVTTTDQIFFEGSRVAGMVGFVASTAETTLWNISTASYRLWKPQSVSVGGQLTFEKVQTGLTKVADLGFNGTMNLHVSNATWQDINDDQAALVRHADKVGGKVTFGYEEIAFYGVTGVTKIKPNIYVKRGIACGFPEGHCKRIGSTDITFQQPGYGKMIREMENSAGVEIRTYADQAYFCDKPAYSILFTGIVNSIDS